MTIDDARRLEAAGFLVGGEELYRQAFNAGRFDEAEAGYRRALSAIEAQLGVDNVDMAAVHHLLAELEHTRGRHAEAESHARTALAVRRADDPGVAADQELLARLLARRADYDQAEQLLRDALATFDATLGTDSDQAAGCAHELATVLVARQQFDEADALYRRALSTRRNVLGPAHPDTAVTLHNWALLCESAGRPEEARLLWAEADAVIAATKDTPSPQPDPPVSDGRR
jgi:tetratricopeptide (TPR) repeat protein